MTLFSLSETQTAIRTAAREFAQRRIAPQAQHNDIHERFPADLLKEMADIGLMGVNVPTEYGGAEAGAVSYALAMMEVAEADAATSVIMAVNNMVAETIMRFGTEAQKREFVPRICDGSFVTVSFALSEPGFGSDPSSMKTIATKIGNKYVITGAKQWITSGTYAKAFIIWARTAPTGNKGITAFLVDGSTPGIVPGKPEEKMGLRASNTVPLTLEDVEVPESALLGEEGAGFKIALVALDGGRIGIASQAIGIGRAALAASIAYAKERAAFGKHLSDFQGTQWKLADMATDLSAAELLALRAAALKDERASFTREASMAKLFASEAANRAVAHAVQIHGGYGYVKDYAVERYYRDARVTTIYEGASEIQRIVIAREVIRELSADSSRI